MREIFGIERERATHSDVRCWCESYRTGELTAFLTLLRADMANTLPSAVNAAIFATRILAFLDLAAIARTYLEYSSGDLLTIMVNAFRQHLDASTNGAATWTICLDAFEGLGQIPLMTVHKSKGLEYDTIVFVGLDDRAGMPGKARKSATAVAALHGHFAL
jgi:ATP-dependent exoDNAse (exonuclease V) beta subunit